VLADLAPDQREVLTLRVVGDLTVEQVADVLGKSRGAVKSLQHRGVAALRRRLQEATP
jgi:RNA polymerase sigma-70 factor (ECF subfamily)